MFACFSVPFNIVFFIIYLFLVFLIIYLFLYRFTHNCSLLFHTSSHHSVFYCFFILCIFISLFFPWTCNRSFHLTQNIMYFLFIVKSLIFLSSTFLFLFVFCFLLTFLVHTHNYFITLFSLFFYECIEGITPVSPCLLFTFSFLPLLLLPHYPLTLPTALHTGFLSSSIVISLPILLNFSHPLFIIPLSFLSLWGYINPSYLVQLLF